jgi:hypothetical protein
VLRQDPERSISSSAASLAKRTERAVAQYGLAERGAQREVDRVDRQRGRLLWGQHQLALGDAPITTW